MFKEHGSWALLADHTMLLMFGLVTTTLTGGLNEIAQMIESAKVLADPAKFAAAAKAASVELHILLLNSFQMKELQSGLRTVSNY